MFCLLWLPARGEVTIVGRGWLPARGEVTMVRVGGASLT